MMETQPIENTMMMIMMRETITEVKMRQATVMVTATTLNSSMTTGCTLKKKKQPSQEPFVPAWTP